jgi:hypothetical protein
MLNGHCAAQSFAAADYATNSIYAGGWAEGQNGGYGFGPWSFFGSDPNGHQSLSTASALGTSWTLLSTSLRSLANAGRAIPGGLQVGQTFEAYIVNPSGAPFYGGWTIAFLDSTNNNPGGVHSGETVSVYHFEYFNYGAWQTSDLLGNHTTTLNASDTYPGGMKLDLTLTATNSYHLVLTPLSNPAKAYTQDGNLKTNAPINWIQFQSYVSASGGTNDVANNFEIGSMNVQGTLLHISWTTNTPGFQLQASPSLNADAVWSSNLPAPVVVNGSNVVTVVASGGQQFYRLQLQQ